MVNAQQFRRNRDLNLGARFAVHQQKIAVHAAFAGGIDHLRREDLQRVMVVTSAGDHGEPLLETLGKEEVGERDHYAAAHAAGADQTHRFLETRRALGLAVEKPARNIGGLASATQVGGALHFAGGEANERNAVLIDQADIRERHR